MEEESPITFNVIMLKAIAEALKKSPKLNSLLHYNTKTKIGLLYRHIKEISISTPWLLPDYKPIAPVIHDVGTKNLQGIADSIKNIRRKIINTDIEVMQYFVAKKRNTLRS
ncbi:MAG: 2-oxo acid dehydrogenase subunit E2 [Candidatus Thermoplasmatota archaeon]